MVTCDHSYDTRCHTSYKTTYSAQQEEECDDNYRKDCFIEYSKTATEAEVKICVEPLVKNCDIPGPEVCRLKLALYNTLLCTGHSTLCTVHCTINYSAVLYSSLSSTMHHTAV